MTRAATGLLVGDPAPWFAGPTEINARFNFATLAGRWVGLMFVRSVAEAQALNAELRLQPGFDETRACLFGVVPASLGEAELGPRWFFDSDGEIARRFGAAEASGWMILDPTLRVIQLGPLTSAAAVADRLAALPDPDIHSGGQITAPVLIVPRVFEPAFCKTLIDHYSQKGGEPSGFMREIDGVTRLLSDPRHKQRKDVIVEDEALANAARARILRRLVPEIHKAFQFQATRIERYLVACYPAGEGWFRPHRDNTTKGTAHRKFAVTLNLNAEDYEGGELRFPEFGSRTYKPPTGGAVVFSCSLLHEATPVTAGERFAFLPFLYDEAGAKIRQQNLRYIEGHPASETEAKQEA